MEMLLQMFLLLLQNVLPLDLKDFSPGRESTQIMKSL